LIGYKTITDLGLLHIVNNVSESKVDSIVEYKDYFVGLEKMKDKTAKLHTHSTLRPVSQKYHR